jgi:hypothetical protein
VYSLPALSASQKIPVIGAGVLMPWLLRTSISPGRLSGEDCGLLRAGPITGRVEASAKEGAGEGKHMYHAEESGRVRNRPVVEMSGQQKNRRHICKESVGLK